jgi:chromosome segregation ATPase
MIVRNYLKTAVNAAIMACCLALAITSAHSYVFTGIPEYDKQLKDVDLKIAEIQRKINDLTAEKQRALDELRRGLYCSECKRTRTQIQSRNENFQDHIRRVKGEVLSASPEQLMAKAAEYDRKIAALQKEIERLRAQGDRVLDQAQSEMARRRKAEQEEELRLMRERRQKQQAAYQKTFDSIQRDQERMGNDVLRRHQERQSSRLEDERRRQQENLRREQEAERRREQQMLETQRMIDSNRAYNQNLDQAFDTLERGIRDIFEQRARDREMSRLAEERWRREQEAERREEERRQRFEQEQLELAEKTRIQAEQDDALRRLQELESRPPEALTDFTDAASSYGDMLGDIVRDAAEGAPLSFAEEVATQAFSGKGMNLGGAIKGVGLNSLRQASQDKLLEVAERLAPENDKWQIRSWKLPLAWTSFDPRKIVKTYEDYVDKEIVSKLKAALKWFGDDEE